MWNVVSYFICFTVGVATGVILMCLLQAGKAGDEWRENMERRNNG